MPTLSANISDELAEILERYRQTRPDDSEAITETITETIRVRALKRFLLEEGFPPEDEPLTDEELDALNAARAGETEYLSWSEVKRDL